MGVPGASALLAGITVILTPMPFLFASECLSDSLALPANQNLLSEYGQKLWAHRL